MNQFEEPVIHTTSMQTLEEVKTRAFTLKVRALLVQYWIVEEAALCNGLVFPGESMTVLFLRPAVCIRIKIVNVGCVRG